MIRIILIDDDAAIRATLLRAFGGQTGSAQYRGMYSLQAFSALGEAFAEEPRPDAILLDLGLGESRGMATIQHAKSVYGDTPMVILTGGNGELEALENGADEYLLKTDIVGAAGYNMLVDAINKAIARKPDGQRWLDTRRRMHDSRERIEVGSRRRQTTKGLVVYGLPVGVIFAAVSFLITQNYVALLPGKASTDDLKTQTDALNVTRDRVIVLETNALQTVRILERLDAKLDTQALEGAELKANVYTLMRAYNIEPRRLPRRQP